MPKIFNIFIIISLIITSIYLSGLLFFITDYEDNKCEMTYMFEYPQYVKIAQRRIDDKYPKYGLYAYSEGRWTQRVRDMHFDGIPVLFLPGNGGSHRQVRSLASVALRKAVNSRTPYHFDYFTIDFNKELSGLNGAVLHEQLEYANYSMRTIFNLYQSRKNIPRSIVLIGHSMGGIIAQRLADRNPDLVNVVLTMASPHRRSPLILDKFISNFYQPIKSKTNIISLYGGHNDFLVPFLLSDSNNTLNVVTTQVPKAWVTVDHLCILWCKQLILAINRALFHSVDFNTRQITTDNNLRVQIFSHHLVTNSGIKFYNNDYYLKKTLINPNGDWIEYLERQYSIILNEGTKDLKWFMVQLLKHTQHQSLTILAVNLDLTDWVYVCGAHIPRGKGRVCEEAYHLTHLSKIAPSAQYKRRSIRVNLHELLDSNKDLTHVIFKTAATKEPVNFHVDIYNENDRRIIIDVLPNWWHFEREILIEQSAEKAIHYEIILKSLKHITEAYYLYVEPNNCKFKEHHHATASLITTWGQDLHKFFTKNDTNPMLLRLYKSKGVHNDSAIVQLTLDPNCRYKISIKSSLIAQLGQIARYYTPLLIANIAAAILMTLRNQLKSIEDNKQCSFFCAALKDGARPYYILPIAKLFSSVFSNDKFTYLNPDWAILTKEGSLFFLLPIFFYVISVGIVWLLGIGLYISMAVFETTVQKISLKFLARTVSFTVAWSDYLMSALHKLPFMVAGTLTCLSFTCGGLSLCLGTVFYFLKLTQLSQDFIEELVWRFMKKLGRKFKKPKNEENPPPNNETENLPIQNAVFFHSTMFLIWFLLTLINLPAVITWAHNFKYSPMLKPDSSFYPGLTLSICALPLWQMELPKIERKWYGAIGDAIMCFAILTLLYSQIFIYRLNYILVSVVVLITIQQVLGPNRDHISEGTEQPIEQKYEQVKAKIE